MIRSIESKKMCRIFLPGFIVCFLSIAISSFADLNINIVAVNGTDTSRDKEIVFPLPKELAAEDVLDTEDLKLKYDPTLGTYVVIGAVTLQPKETKAIRVRVKDKWKFEDSEVEEIKNQIDLSLERLKNTEHYARGEEKKDALLNRLNFIKSQQDRFADNVEKRIDQYRVYSDEFNAIRSKAVSVKYWRSQLPEARESKTLTYVIELTNPKEEIITSDDRFYLPEEINSEYIVDLQGFDIRFDPDKEQSYLIKEEELKPGEVKRYSIGIYDVWSIPQADIDNVKDRAIKVFKLLEKTQYGESAKYLVASIKGNLDGVEQSQAAQKELMEHISSYKFNQKKLEAALADVKTMEELLEAVRENLERSQLKNVLQRIKQLKSVGNIAEAVFGVKPSINNMWKIITVTVLFVGLLTIIHFSIWAKRSKKIDAEDAGGEEAGRA